MTFVRALSVVVAVACASGFAADLAQAESITVTYTGDNVVGAFYQNGAAPVSITVGSNASNWRSSDSATLTLSSGTEYQLVFRVKNDGAFRSNNPASFLAQITGDVVGGPIYTSTSWEVAAYGGSTPSDFDTLSWSSATSWGTNGGSNIWTTNNSGNPVSGISTSADWIWTDKNFASGDVSEAWLRVTFNTTPVPEPASVLLLGLGVAGVAVVRRRQR